MVRVGDGNLKIFLALQSENLATQLFLKFFFFLMYWFVKSGHLRTMWTIFEVSFCLGLPIVQILTIVQIRSDQISRSVVSDSLRPHESQHARPPCPSPTPRVQPSPLRGTWEFP